LGSCKGRPQPSAITEQAYIININFMLITMTE
jgi:hypothetical protein